MADHGSKPDKTLDSTPPLPDHPDDAGSASEQVKSLVRNVSLSKLNAQAPEFVPVKTQTPPPPMVIAAPPSPPPQLVPVFPPSPPFHVAVPPQSHLHYPQIHPHPQHQHHHHHQYHPGHRQKHHGKYVGGGGEQEAAVLVQQASSHGNAAPSNGLSDDAIQKVLNQVEFYFSDVNLATTDHLIRFMNKDPEGYVPMSVVASFKKIKAFISSNAQLAAVLRNSTKLVVSEDGKKVRRLHPLTGPDMEELQCRIIVAENLPEDHSHQNLMKVFSSVGSVKSIRTCLPQPSNNGASSAARPSKTDNVLYNNKLHTFVEYESIEMAEKAVEELNDEDDWRNGLRVRLLHKRLSKSKQGRGVKAGNEGGEGNEEVGTSTPEQALNDRQSDDHSAEYELHFQENVGEEQGGEKEGGQKKARSRGGRSKGRGRGQSHPNNHNHGPHHIGSPPASHPATASDHPTAPRQPLGPRMPDGTRGFSMGRGKPVTVNTA